MFSCCENFFRFQHQEPCHDFTCPPSPFLESWRTWMFLTNLEMVPYDMYQSYEVALKISSKSNIRNHVKTLLVLIVPSWSLGGHVGFLTTWRKCHMTCINPLKMLWKFHQNQTSGTLSRLHVLQAPSWSIGGHGGSWWTLRWCHINRSILITFLWGFHQEPTLVRYLIYTAHSKSAIFIGKKVTDKQTHEQ